MAEPVSPPTKKRKEGDLVFFRHKTLGKGSFGAVFEGSFNGENVAVKRILRDDYRKVEEHLLGVSHRNLVKYHAIRDDDDFVCIAMELCAGTLQDVVDGTYKGPDAGPKEIMLLQTSLGLEFLHAQKIIHRDIKPRNILISVPARDRRRPLIKLADFGLCKLNTGDRTHFTKSMNVIGTEGWAAPESSDENVNRINFSADVFSLGCVMGYVLSGGSHPFGDDSYARGTKMKTGQIDWRNMYLVANAKMRTTIRDMISKEPDNRPTLSSVNTALQQRLQTLILDCCKKMDFDREDELLENMQFFVDEQLSLNFTDVVGRNPLMLVCEKRIYGNSERAKRTLAMQSKCIEILLSDAASSLIDLKHKDQFGYNALHSLCEYYKGEDVVKIAALLIRRGVDVNEKGAADHTALHYVFGGNNETKTQELVKLLLEHGANVDSRAIDGMTPLHYLTGWYRGRDICDVMRLLLDAGAKVNAKDNDGQNALHLLCAGNSGHAMLKEAIVLLIDKGIVNKKDKFRKDAIGYLNDIKPPNVDELVRLLAVCRSKFC